eukprot:TRINITY_DN33243_c0_g1_i1.p1 TRINITY_DN33243_c0_g1~~TRINITY_DN33243_c0_g1_i1.p1  ORF type:complete len:264 (+),score=62.00 TRINITY_DN33243_c0_g1_i1:63-854(+)
MCIRDRNRNLLWTKRGKAYLIFREEMDNSKEVREGNRRTPKNGQSTFADPALAKINKKLLDIAAGNELKRGEESEEHSKPGTSGSGSVSASHSGKDRSGGVTIAVFGAADAARHEKKDDVINRGMGKPPAGKNAAKREEMEKNLGGDLSKEVKQKVARQRSASVRVPAVTETPKEKEDNLRDQMKVAEDMYNTFKSMLMASNGGSDNKEDGSAKGGSEGRVRRQSFRQYQSFWQFYRLMRHLCLLYTSPSPRDGLLSRMPSSA